jgi:hypothetical protein
MNIEFTKASNPAMYEAFARVINHICDKHQTQNEREVLNLIQQEFQVRLMRKPNGLYATEYITTEYIAHFANEQACTMFMLRWL